MLQEPILRREDFSTPTWRRLTAHLQARLQMLRVENDRHADEKTTASTRGSIEEVLDLLALAEKADASDSIAPGFNAGGEFPVDA